MKQKIFDVLYADYDIDKVMASRNVNANGAKRGKISELLVHSYRNTKDWQLNDINNHKSQRVDKTKGLCLKISINLCLN